jgi:hypothetical protein
MTELAGRKSTRLWENKRDWRLSVHRPIQSGKKFWKEKVWESRLMFLQCISFFRCFVNILYFRVPSHCGVFFKAC